MNCQLHLSIRICMDSISYLEIYDNKMVLKAYNRFESYTFHFCLKNETFVIIVPKMSRLLFSFQK